MATHNQARLVGFLTRDPYVMDGKIFFQMRTTRRGIEGYRGPEFEDIIIYYDGEPLFDKLSTLKMMDLIDVKGVVNVVNTPKSSICPVCGCTHTKYNGTATYIYPISCIKLNGLATSFESDADIPEKILKDHYEEVSNQVLVIGNVASEPEFYDEGKFKFTRYMLKVDRKYYINTQDDSKLDLPWVYSYGAQAESDAKYLERGSVILVDGIMHNGRVDSKAECDECHSSITFKDIKSELVPYSIEYLSNFKTDEDIEIEEMIGDLGDEAT